MNLGGTVDEMAHANQQVIFITDEDYERITEERKARAELAMREYCASVSSIHKR